ncbi:hypothetical protein NQ315_015424 [Exocentrus adspersus]|uniref:carbonic anhydrase n=1 Tax=Exocentrus adspersus TaxID=1586481 RepID=A0AAV8VMS6_9CUCU|nr:hypothetical protein NQ315_015424 [Exocentrus adspersus]
MLLLDGISSWFKFKLILFNDISVYPIVCQKEKRQSPIGICKEKAKSAFIPPLVFYYYNFKYKVTVENNGQTLIMKIFDDSCVCELPTVTGGNLDGEYVLDNIHFHWNSEHTINGKRFPLESHLVHYNKKCGTLENAMKHPKGLVVMAVMFEIGHCYNPKLDNILSTTEMISNKLNKPREIDGGLIIDYLLPQDKNKYYTYEGSLTVPDFNETVQWIVFERILPIGDDQLKRLTKIQLKGSPIKSNTRHLQDSNNRHIYYATDKITAKKIKDYIKEKFRGGC